jgi:FkbM family methyltransferase
MSFISYAQNFEDVILWRALKHVEKGFYIDVGAYDPDLGSVTKAFYDRGWLGINVEPISQCFKKIQAARPRDINLNVAAGSEDGEIILYEIRDGLSTINRQTAEGHLQKLGYEFIERKFPVRQLTGICSEYREAPIHFLKIDAEGAEKSVLEGLNLKKIRPWIILIESTLPWLQTENYHQWEPLLVESNYEFVYFDGLNRYYIAAERDELRVAFYAPPNVFDDFIRADERDALSRAEEAQSRGNQLETEVEEAQSRGNQLETEVEEAQSRSNQLETEVEEAQSRGNQLETEVEEAQSRSNQLEQELRAVYVSKSWRMTHPLRIAMNGIRRVKAKIALVPRGMKHAVRVIIKALLAPVIRFALARPALKSRAQTVVRKHPMLESRLRRLAAARGLTEVDTLISTSQQQLSPVELSHLTPTARRIYIDLKAAISDGPKDLS